MDYLYPHNYPHSIVKQQYLPDNIKNRHYYEAKLTSKNEENLKIIYDKIKKYLG